MEFPNVHLESEKKRESTLTNPSEFIEHPSFKEPNDPKAKLRDNISREFVKILRHTAEHKNLFINDEGFVRINDLIQLNSRTKKADIEMVKKIVEENNKQRFELKQNEETNEFWIRCSQGHSIKNLDDQKMMKPITGISNLSGVTVVHGTNLEAWSFIIKSGLNKMGRNHIHFARGYPHDKDVISGMRKSCNIFVELDIGLAMHNGIKFYESNNGVILSPGINGAISPMFFKCVFQLNPETKERVRIFGNQDLVNFKLVYGYQYLFVLDFEANCSKENSIDPQEIIEFPIVVIDAVNNLILKDKTFHYYVKPDVHKVTEFCTDLTGITQELVETKGFKLADVLIKFEDWVKLNVFNLEECCFVTCGSWDLKTALKKESVFRKINLNPFFKKFINAKEVFTVRCNFRENKFGMVDMLTELGLELEGKHHSGIDDCGNIARILIKLLSQDRFITKDFTKFVV